MSSLFLIQLISTILHRYRKGKLGTNADIKNAFGRIKLNTTIRPLLNFCGNCNKLQITFIFSFFLFLLLTEVTVCKFCVRKIKPLKKV